MKHRQFEEWLPLYLYNELNDQERELFENHLDSCSNCRSELDAMRKMQSELANYRPIEINESLLQDARRKLRLQILDRIASGSLLDKLKNIFYRISVPSFQMVYGGVTIFTIGIFVGYLVFKTPFDDSSFAQRYDTTSKVEAGEIQIVNIKFLEQDTKTGDVEFSFETVTPMRIRGNVNDERVQKVLARALISDQNTGVRLRALNMIASHSELRNANHNELDNEVKASLINALLHDYNLGVRREALNVLKNYLPDSTIVRAFLNVLANEKNTGLKIATINALDLSKYENQNLNKEILEMYKKKAQSDENNYIRIKAKTALQEVEK